MAYRSTRRAISANEAGKGKDSEDDLLPQTPADLIAMSRGRAKLEEQQQASGRHPQMVAATTRLSAGRRGARQQGWEHNESHEARASTPPPAAGRIDELTTKVIALTIRENGIITTARGADGREKKKVQTVAELKQELQGMCRTVFSTLGRQQRESAYQSALQIELERRGITVEVQ